MPVVAPGFYDKRKSPAPQNGKRGFSMMRIIFLGPRCSVLGARSSWTPNTKHQLLSHRLFIDRLLIHPIGSYAVGQNIMSGQDTHEDIIFYHR